MIDYKDWEGKRFGRLTVIGYAGEMMDITGGKHEQLLCKCDCGRTEFVRDDFLKSGKVECCDNCFATCNPALFGTEE